MTGRLAGAVVAVALIVLGVVLAARPVSDQVLRAHATATTTGSIVATRTTWDGSQLLTVAWHSRGGQQRDSQLEDYNSWPPWQPGDDLQVSFDPSHPGTDVVLAEPTWNFAVDFRADAVFQAIVPFTLAGIVLALAVIWPGGRWIYGRSAWRARRSLRVYVLTPAVICGLAAAAAVVIQDQPASAYSLGADKIVGWLSVVLMLLLIWPYVRAVQFYRLRLLLTVQDDAADNAASITSVSGRRMQLGDVQMVVLAGQSARVFQAGQTVRRYGRWEKRGPAVITDGYKLLIGIAKRTAQVRQDDARPSAVADKPVAAADILTEPLSGQYPQLARKPRRFLVRALVLLAVVVGGSLAVGASLGTKALGPLWLAWMLSVLVIGLPALRYRQLSRLLHRPHVADNGVVASVTRSWYGTFVAITAMSSDTALWLRLVGEREVSWLVEGQAVVLLHRPTPAIEAVLLSTEDGHAALATATVAHVRNARATVSSR